jgi:Putative transposase
MIANVTSPLDLLAQPNKKAKKPQQKAPQKNSETTSTEPPPAAPLHNSDWVVYCKEPFGGPEEVLRYLARYTHRVAISNRRLIACDEKGVTFKWKDYRIEGPERYKIMTLATNEFIRRFLMHVLPAGFHRIRYYGLLASGKRAENVARARELLMPPIIPVDAIKAIAPNVADSPSAAEPQKPNHSCPCCGGRMIIIERFEPGATPHHQPSPPKATVRIDTS